MFRFDLTAFVPSYSSRMFSAHRLTYLFATLLLLGGAMTVPAGANVASAKVAVEDPYLGNTPGVIVREYMYPVVVSKQVTLHLYRVYRSDLDATTPANFELSIMRRSMLAARPGPAESVFVGVANSDTTLKNVALRAGEIACFRTRQVIAGVASGWSTSTCVVRPADDRKLVAKRGSIRRVDNRHFPDGRATMMSEYARLSFRGLPPVTFYGVVFRQPEVSECVTGVKLGAGKGRPKNRLVSSWSGAFKGSGRYRSGDHRAQLILTGMGGNVCPIGGVFAVPRWMDVMNGYLGPYHVRTRS